MATTPPFKYQPMFEKVRMRLVLSAYRRLYVSVSEFEEITYPED